MHPDSTGGLSWWALGRPSNVRMALGGQQEGPAAPSTPHLRPDQRSRAGHR